MSKGHPSVLALRTTLIPLNQCPSVAYIMYHAWHAWCIKVKISPYLYTLSLYFSRCLMWKTEGGIQWYQLLSVWIKRRWLLTQNYGQNWAYAKSHWDHQRPRIRSVCQNSGKDLLVKYVHIAHLETLHRFILHIGLLRPQSANILKCISKWWKYKQHFFCWTLLSQTYKHPLVQHFHPILAIIFKVKMPQNSNWAELF